MVYPPIVTESQKIGPDANPEKYGIVKVAFVAVAALGSYR
jgi:hypothetical protein